jgi:hypothetical protein
MAFESTKTMEKLVNLYNGGVSFQPSIQSFQQTLRLK